MQIDFQVSGDDELLANLSLKFTLLTKALAAKLNVINTRMQQRIQQKLSGEVLKVQSGKLLRSVEMIPAEIQADQITGGVQAGGGPAFYAKFQEFGTKGPYEIVPVNAQALRFLVGDKTVFAKRVMHPGLEPRSFMGSTLEEMAPDIIAGLQETVAEVAAQ